MYDYNVDPYERVNHAANGSYAIVLEDLQSVLRRQ
eukprot:COSAG05_NODE_15704_length_363_cov_1.246212_1_plen_34_part_01